jgi:CIC family chloride channel protein
MVRHEQVILFILAVVIGVLGGGGAILFREAIAFFQGFVLEAQYDRLADLYEEFDWWQVVLSTTSGGLIVGLIAWRLIPGRRVHGVADVIEANALRDGQMNLRVGLLSALSSAVSIGAGASVGREGPVVHLGATLGAWIAEKLHLGRSLARTLLGCGVAAAVAASFNAPIAGWFFALEVVVGHYALGASAPVVIASVAGTMVSRSYFGDYPAFIIGTHDIASFLEFPAFAILGLLSAMIAIVFMRSISSARSLMQRSPIPIWLQPAIGGLIVGLIAIAYPQVLGVGYAATDDALREALTLTMLFALLAVKLIATAISLGCGFGGGVFSPSLFLGAMLGGAFGVLATLANPELSSGPGAYTIVGMGAVAGAVLGAPISTILMIFELTGDYALTVAVMVATIVATLVTRYHFGHSYFTWQLERRGLNVRQGHEQRVLRDVKVAEVMSDDTVTVEPADPMIKVREKLAASPYGTLFVVDKDGGLHGTITFADLSDTAFDTEIDILLNAQDVARLHPPTLESDQDLGVAMRWMQAEGEDHIAVIDNAKTQRLLGVVHQRDVMMAYRRAILAARGEDSDAV